MRTSTTRHAKDKQERTPSTNESSFRIFRGAFSSLLAIPLAALVPAAPNLLLSSLFSSPGFYKSDFHFHFHFHLPNCRVLMALIAVAFAPARSRTAWKVSYFQLLFPGSVWRRPMDDFMVKACLHNLYIILHLFELYSPIFIISLFLFAFPRNYWVLFLNLPPPPPPTTSIVDIITLKNSQIYWERWSCNYNHLSVQIIMPYWDQLVIECI